MGQMVELEGAPQASQPGAQVTLPADTSTLVASPGPRKALILANDTASTIYVRFAADGASAEDAVPVNLGQ